MSDRRPSKPEDGYANQLDNLAALMGTNKAIRETTGTIVADSICAALLGYADVLRDPVAVVRRGVESGTIKGKERRYCEAHDSMAITPGYRCDHFRLLKATNNEGSPCRMIQTLVIGPVSDGGSET